MLRTGAFYFGLFAEEFEISTDGYYLFDLNHNLLMKSYNVDKEISPSSTAKIMSACIVLESNIDLSTKITVTKNMINNVT